jgi:hypothetical protein
VIWINLAARPVNQPRATRALYAHLNYQRCSAILDLGLRFLPAHQPATVAEPLLEKASLVPAGDDYVRQNGYNKIYDH